jgi:hypothetical protein
MMAYTTPPLHAIEIELASYTAPVLNAVNAAMVTYTTPALYAFAVPLAVYSTPSLSDAGFVLTGEEYDGILKRWSGATWVKEPLGVYAGTWVSKPLKWWNGTGWKIVDTTGV